MISVGFFFFSDPSFWARVTLVDDDKDDKLKLTGKLGLLQAASDFLSDVLCFVVGFLWR